MKLQPRFSIVAILLFIVIDLSAQLHQTTIDCRWRSGPGVKYRSLGIIKSGEKVNVLKRNNTSWSQIEYNGKKGFISNKYLTAVEEQLQVEEILKPVEPINKKNETSITKSTIFYIIGGVLLLAMIFALSRRNKSKIEEDKTFYKVNKSFDKKGKEVENKNAIENNIQNTNTTDEMLDSNINTDTDDIETIEIPTLEDAEILINIPEHTSLAVDDMDIKDASIIDVTGQDYSIKNEQIGSYHQGIPIWKHQYVYSASEIYNASEDQIKFYNDFKDQFLKGHNIDLEGNSNYAFILLFDLINDYEKHKDLKQVQKQLNELGQYYPKTKPYLFRSLIKKLEQLGDYNAIAETKSTDNFIYSQQVNPFSSFTADRNYWALGTQFRDILPLTNEEVELLNQILFYSNSFFEIKFCSIEIIKLYLALIKELHLVYNVEGTTVESTVSFIADIVVKKHTHYGPDTESYKVSLETYKGVIYTAILKICENVIREKYFHKRKLNTGLEYFNQEGQSEYNKYILSKVLQILPKLELSIIPPDINTEIELNCRNTTRWKIKYEELEKKYKGNSNQFIEDIIMLGNANKRNPCIENIFFQASKFISKSNKETALKLYVHYLYHDLQSTSFDNKQLTKTIQKNLFKTNEQLHDFEIIVSNLVKDKNLEIALQQVSNIYVVKRKKIQIDTSSIKEVQQQHSGTVELLNEYLKDEYEDESNTIQSEELNNDELQIVITQKEQPLQKSIYTEKIDFDLIQMSTIDFFFKNSFILAHKDLENFTKSKNIFMNQHIDSINEVCFDYLNDILIEEEDECYTINPDYYQRLLNT